MKKRRQKKRKNKFLKLKIIGFIVFGLLIAGVALSFSPVGKDVQQVGQKAVNLCVQKAHFNLERVVVEGHIRTKLNDLNAKLNLRQGMPIFEIDLEKEKQSVLELPWIKTVRIERHLPTQILISVTEKKPIAVWQNKKKYWPIDENGEAILDDKTLLKNVLLVVGEDAPEHTPELIEILNNYPDIASVTRSAVRVGKRRWNLYLNDAENGLEIRLPETGIKEALARLTKFKEEGDILNRDIKVIDLKLPDRLIVKSNSSLK
ncbi:MAG: FtsQ-type POTRA domain-containing protein [Alphaproteobacteria bacterium]|nr:FtsQ-type POTRA domain-containing protein [Alphaproteobacteria bacterium]